MAVDYGKQPTKKPLSSLWDGLSPYLIASFYEVDKNGVKKEGAETVNAPLTESNLDASLNWQSPFEQMGPESRAPALLAMLQSGQLQPIIDATVGKQSGVAGSLQENTNSFLNKFEGRTGITKLNSVQVFSGMPPVKIQVTALFRAWRDADEEVEIPFNQLMSWALPVELSKDSTVLSNAIKFLINGDKTSDKAIQALFPSKAPVMVGMTYKGRTYAPLVIESIGCPINSPIDKKGNFVELSIPLTLATLTAIDRGDWVKFNSR